MIVPEPTQYQMVFCDTDGTLLDSIRRISPGTRRKIQELDRIGIPFILVSARMPSVIFPLQHELGTKASIVCYNGALILNEHGDPVKTIGIDRGKAILIDDFVKREREDVCCSACCHRNQISDNIHDRWIMQEQSITVSVSKEGKIPDSVPQEGQAHKLSCTGKAGVIVDPTHALKESFSGPFVYCSRDTYLEIMNEAASKSGAVKHLYEAYGIPMEVTVSLGDNFSDINMLLATGTCFAMGNAPPGVKRQVRDVTEDNGHEGMLAGLEQLSFAEDRI